MAKDKATPPPADDEAYEPIQGTVGAAPASKKNSRPSHEEIQMAAHEQVKWNAEREALKAKIGSFRKGLKLKGFALKKLDDEVRKLEWSAEELKDDREERDWYAEAMAQPIGQQLELYGTDATPDGVREQLKWRQIGVRHGLAGFGWANEAPENCPHDCHQSYGEGHEEGQATVRRSFELRLAKAAAATPESPAEPDDGQMDIEGAANDATDQQAAA